MVTREEFVKYWQRIGESQEPHSVDTAWRRYRIVHIDTETTYYKESVRDDPSSAQLQSTFQPLLEDPTIKQSIEEYKFITLPANRIPWTATGLRLRPGQTVSTFSTGRVWRSDQLDLYLRPQFALWFRVGVNGTVFNSTGHTNTFQVQNEGELYTANQFPGQFGEPSGGRLATPLKVYEKADGKFEILTIVWKDGVNAQEILKASSQKTDLVNQEIERIHRDAHPSVPDDWKLLWFLGTSSIYSLQTLDGQPCMHCKPHLNTGILQKNFTPPLPFKKMTHVSWEWLISSLPSRLREDTSFTHDYLSIAFEFENGRDLTYTWSWELPKDFGYWCPLPAWADREYHVVIRSGTDGLGKWISEERDLHADYVKYVEEGKEDSEGIPKQIVRAWFIAGNRWQRYEGEMSVKRLRVHLGDDEVVDVL